MEALLKVKFIFLWVIVPFILVLTGCMEANREADRCFSEGINYERVGDIEKAINSTNSSVNIDDIIIIFFLIYDLRLLVLQLYHE